MHAKRQAVVSKTRAAVQEIQDALAEHRIEEGNYPATLDDIVDQLDDSFVLEDGWGNAYEYIYDSSSDRYKLRSFGPDGIRSDSNPDAADDDIVGGIL